MESNYVIKEILNREGSFAFAYIIIGKKTESFAVLKYEGENIKIIKSTPFKDIGYMVYKDTINQDKMKDMDDEQKKKFMKYLKDKEREELIESVITTPDGKLDPKGVHFINVSEKIQQQKAQEMEEKEVNTIIQDNGKYYIIYRFDGTKILFPIPKEETIPTTKKGASMLARKYKGTARMEFDNGNARKLMKNFSKGSELPGRRNGKNS